jgi:hypothetical protein
MRLSRWLLVIALGVMALTLAACAVKLAPVNGEYGESIRYAPRRPITFPDFTLEYTGQHRVITPRYARGFLYHDFRLTQGAQTETVSWTDGTGVLGPIDFTFDGKPYTLEISQWDTIGPVEFGTVVVDRSGS